MSSYICSDLMVQIFERLPPKSIIRFQSLSKYWHSRLLSPEFLKDHRLRCSKNPPKVIIRHIIGHGNHEKRDIYTLHSADQFDPGSGLVFIPGVEFPYAQKVSVIGSCNGILCLYDKNKEILSLCNFSIRRKLNVPCRLPLKSRTYAMFALGFGFDPITDDYNIVAICYNIVAIPSPSTPLIYYTYLTRKACFFHGKLHWLVHGYSTTHGGPSNYILTFSLSSRVFGYILLPKSWKVEQVTTINGCLAVVHTEYNNFLKDDYSWIRVMKEYGNIESLSPLSKVKRDSYRRMTVFQPIINGDILAYFRAKGSKVYLYKQTNVTNHLEFGTDCCKLQMDTYVESLELVDRERATTCGKTVFSWTEKDSLSRMYS
ncbi:F-box/kelch-repeat protein At2g43445-like [Bidens hawaiensis]|uniref:F-box/kelch-repeat protein At2g43445-like n=1 Tax=Bidens hawaiensis TaxID=980011 RepID=UPI00404A406C